MGCTTPMHTLKSKPLYRSLREHSRRAVRDRGPGHLLQTLSSGQGRNVATMNSQQYGWLHKTCQDHTHWFANTDGENFTKPNPRWRSLGSQWLLREEEVCLISFIFGMCLQFQGVSYKCIQIEVDWQDSVVCMCIINTLGTDHGEKGRWEGCKYSM